MGVGSVAEHLPSIQEALSLIPSLMMTDDNDDDDETKVS